MLKPAFLALDKPVGVRSTQCVEDVRRALERTENFCSGHERRGGLVGRVRRGVKVGHGGTLDSSASGLLVVLVAGATRLSGIVMSMPKTYRVVVRLGAETSTCDYTGEELFSSDWSGVGTAEVDAVLPSLLGWRMQTPPKASAVHVGGRRAHEIMRAGGDPDIAPRPVFIEWIKRLGSVSFEGDFSLLIRCGKGTYIRSIVRDIGRALGCGAHVSSLVRESVGPFTRRDALRLDAESGLNPDKLLEAMTPVTILEEFLPAYSMPEDDMLRLSNGLCAFFSHASRRSFGKFPPPGAMAFVSQRFFSIGRVERRDGALCVMPDVNIINTGKVDIGE
ncbi:MAG: tRNA pseudouridine(55) synthase TruB [Synergistaceae bacterium]|jgi:tRNA pseudouridine(55) synthase|nr:tRNA pseudouridine(55) synthase TruB [Synergistaceae bacterium]